jgi:hypothetical protein
MTLKKGGFITIGSNWRNPSCASVACYGFCMFVVCADSSLQDGQTQNPPCQQIRFHRCSLTDLYVLYQGAESVRGSPQRPLPVSTTLWTSKRRPP